MIRCPFSSHNHEKQEKVLTSPSNFRLECQGIQVDHSPLYSKSVDRHSAFIEISNGAPISFLSAPLCIIQRTCSADVTIHYIYPVHKAATDPRYPL